MSSFNKFTYLQGLSSDESDDARDYAQTIGTTATSATGTTEDKNLPSTELSPVQTAIKGKPAACVFVASLCASMTDDDLGVAVTTHFRQWGDLVAVKVLRDTSNRPYAFVQYETEQAAGDAIAHGRHLVLHGRRLRCEAAKVNRTLFLSCPEPMPEGSVRDLARQYGPCELVRPSDPSGWVRASVPPLGSTHWFVKFTYRDDAIRAFASMADHVSVSVQWTRNVDDVPAPKRTFDKCSIFVGQLNRTTTAAQFAAHFQQYGAIASHEIIHRASSSFGFIQYHNEAAAAAAVDRENHTMFNGKTIHVHYRELQRVERDAARGAVLAPPPVHVRQPKKFTDPKPRRHRGRPWMPAPPVDEPRPLGSLLLAYFYYIPSRSHLFTYQ